MKTLNRIYYEKLKAIIPGLKMTEKEKHNKESPEAVGSSGDDHDSSEWLNFLLCF